MGPGRPISKIRCFARVNQTRSNYPPKWFSWESGPPLQPARQPRQPALPPARHPLRSTFPRWFSRAASPPATPRHPSDADPCKQKVEECASLFLHSPPPSAVPGVDSSANLILLLFYFVPCLMLVLFIVLGFALTNNDNAMPFFLLLFSLILLGLMVSLLY